MKTCPSCSKDLPDSNFSVNNALPDGLARTCRTCTRAYAKAWREKTLPAWERKTQQPGYATQRKREYLARNPEKKREIERKKTQRRRWKDMAKRGLATQIFLTPQEIRRRYLARKRINKAVSRGQIAKWPCVLPDCGALDVHGHHPDYDRPRDVVWLCDLHHREVHAMI